eukprot:6016028-Pleurochrysis_carterae.AAC.1
MNTIFTYRRYHGRQGHIRFRAPAIIMDRAHHQYSTTIFPDKTALISSTAGAPPAHTTLAQMAAVTVMANGSRVRQPSQLTGCTAPHASLLPASSQP